jgi:nitrile hydratase accessory protein
VNEAVNRAVSAMSGTAALPRDNGELVFEAPWQGRALGMAVAVVERLGLEWDEFRQRLIAAIGEDPDRPYYESWVAALETLVVERGVVGAEELTSS